MQQPVFLIGFMGSGKSFTGRGLARRLNLAFIDLDDYIEQQAGRSIRQLFDEEGESAFRLREASALRHIGAQEGVVIACGGGTPCFNDNMAWMNARGITVFLDTPVAVIAGRLIREMDHRPLLYGLTAETLVSFIEDRLKDRLPYYRQAAVVFSHRENETDAAAELARRLLDNFS